MIRLIVGSFAVVHLFHWALPGVLDAWNDRLTDQLFVLRDRLACLRPAYRGEVVHVDLTNGSLRKLECSYPNRTHFARLVTLLDSMRVAGQLWDFLLPARLDEAGDQALVEAVARAGPVYFGMAFDLRRGDMPPAAEPDPHLQATRLPVQVAGDAGGLYPGTWPQLTFPELATAATGQGFLNIRADRDGVFRRIPLLVRSGGAFYPSLPLRVACDYLQVEPERIVLVPGRHLLLPGARFPDGSVRDVAIPVDDRAQMRVNFIGPWERLRHYDFAEVLRAEGDREALDLWREELAGRLMVVADVSTGSSDIGPVPTDEVLPLCAIHSNTLLTILNGDFLREASPLAELVAACALAAVLLGLSWRLRSWGFVAAVAGVVVVYMAGAVAGFFYGGLLLDIVPPMASVILAVLPVTLYRMQHSESEAHHLEKELRKAHDMQMGLMPGAAPEIEGLELAGRCIPASHVGGDFFQYFRPSPHCLTFSLADITGHAMEAAIPAVMFSGILASQMEAGDSMGELFGKLNRSLHRILDERVNVCFAMGELDPLTRAFRVANCGCPYPYHFRARTGEIAEIEVNAFPLGSRPDTLYPVREIQLEPGDYVLFCSDGIIEAGNSEREMFGFGRTAQTIRDGCMQKLTAPQLLDYLLVEVRTFSATMPQEDDQTIIVLRVDG